MNHLFRTLGFFLLVSGWALALTAAILLSGKALLPVFVTSGLAVEAVGIALLFRAHRKV